MRRNNVLPGRAALTVLGATVLLVPAPPAVAQLPAVPAAMDRLDFLVGEWEGTGWMEYAPGQRAEFRGTEVVERRMGGRVVVVEGDFTAYMGPARGDVPVHQALGVFSYDGANDRFLFRTYTARGGNGDAHDAEVVDGRIVWGYDDPSWGRVRYTIELTEAGEWRESGHVTPDDGASWHQFFEMTLARK